MVYSSTFRTFWTSALHPYPIYREKRVPECLGGERECWRRRVRCAHARTSTRSLGRLRTGACQAEKVPKASSLLPSALHPTQLTLRGEASTPLSPGWTLPCTLFTPGSFLTPSSDSCPWHHLEGSFTVFYITSCWPERRKEDDRKKEGCEEVKARKKHRDKVKHQNTRKMRDTKRRPIG